jgi:hypothetical protein
VDHLTTNLLRTAGEVVAAIALSLVVRTVRPGAMEVNGQRVLAYGRPIKALAIVFWLCWVGFFVAAIFAPAEDRVVAAVVVLGFLLLALSLHLEFFGVRVVFDASGIRARSPWRPTRMIPWSAVTHVWYSPVLRWYVVETASLGCLRLHDFLSGTDTLLNELERRGMAVVKRPLPDQPPGL